MERAETLDISPDEVSRARSVHEHHRYDLLRRRHVVGSGLGFRVSRGGRAEPFIGVFVSLSPRSRVRIELPPRVRTPHGSVRVIREWTRPVLVQDLARYNPLRGGCRITTRGGQGTLGGFAMDALTGRVVAITANHVVTTAAAAATLPSDGRVWQPAAGPSFGVLDRIGLVEAVSPLFPPSLANGVGIDAARIALLPHRWLFSGGPSPVPVQLLIDERLIDTGTRAIHSTQCAWPGLAVECRGSETGTVRRGVVDRIDVGFVDQNLFIGGSGIGFRVCSEPGERFALRGDSGALLTVASGGRATVGLLAGTAPDPGLPMGAVSYGYGIQIDQVLGRLGLVPIPSSPPPPPPPAP